MSVFFRSLRHVSLNTTIPLCTTTSGHAALPRLSAARPTALTLHRVGSPCPAAQMSAYTYAVLSSVPSPFPMSTANNTTSMQLFTRHYTTSMLMRASLSPRAEEEAEMVDAKAGDDDLLDDLLGDVSTTPSMTPVKSLLGKTGEPISGRCVHPKVTSSPRKMRIVANYIRGLSYSEALLQLSFLHKKAATHIADALKSAAANATYQGADPDRLLITEIVATVGGGKVKKPRFHARGRTGLVSVPNTYLRVVVTEVPYQEGEKRLGRVGRVHPEWREAQREKKRLELSGRKSYQRRQAQKAARLGGAQSQSGVHASLSA
eukprot:CAMPEP_0177651644 /NCGR_PEP_ID=MMETSP0447-20121125/12672_1 /TAXON_ID=0 /ORGANISM="Stygamoeba regulata, Strain BSH-02190019" /LENGTH=317 /DNA_ID=CAMNT_0019154767 /DNA_START=63 /DNA_END=1016 /DNA_ORIENTATION=+